MHIKVSFFGFCHRLSSVSILPLGQLHVRAYSIRESKEYHG
jgi:hypothetical protein